MNTAILEQENAVFHATGGVSANNRSCGFLPAFRNNDDGHVYASRFSDGRLAPVHILDGLPDEVVVCRSPSGRVMRVKASVQAGFILDGVFYGRDEAARHSQRLAARSAQLADAATC